jgi:hypothetical protein
MAIRGPNYQLNCGRALWYLRDFFAYAYIRFVPISSTMKMELRWENSPPGVTRGQYEEENWILIGTVFFAPWLSAQSGQGLMFFPQMIFGQDAPKFLPLPSASHCSCWVGKCP